MSPGLWLLPVVLVVLVAIVAFLWASIRFEARVFTLGLESGMLNLDAAPLDADRASIGADEQPATDPVHSGR